MQYFIKRNEKINGPFTDVQIKSGISAGKLNDTDMISNSEEGPWMTWGMLSNYASRQQQEGGSVESGDSESAAEIVVEIYKDLFKGTAQAFRQEVQDGLEQHEQRTADPAFDTNQAVSGEEPSVPDGNSATDIPSTGNSRTNNCSDCGGLISVQVSTCPHCGAPTASSELPPGPQQLGDAIEPSRYEQYMNWKRENWWRQVLETVLLLLLACCVIWGPTYYQIIAGGMIMVLGIVMVSLRISHATKRVQDQVEHAPGFRKLEESGDPVGRKQNAIKNFAVENAIIIYVVAGTIVLAIALWFVGYFIGYFNSLNQI